MNDNMYGDKDLLPGEFDPEESFINIRFYDALKIKFGQLKQLSDADSAALRKTEAKIAWQGEMLERAKELIGYFNSEDMRKGDPTGTWLSDLEKGVPQ